MNATIPGRRHVASTLILALGAASAVALSAGSAAASTTTTFDQNGSLLVGDPGAADWGNFTSLTIPSIGPASSYPSVVTVPHDAVITDVNVSLVNLTHTFPDDLDILLVGPHGQQVTLLSDAGFTNDLSGGYTFDDAAATAPTDSGALPPGTYRPADFGSLASDTYPSPAPAPTGNTSLAVFNGTNAAGDWQLYINDDTANDTGSMTGWYLELAMSTTPYPSTVDVQGTGVVSDVDVALHGLTSTYPDDLDLLLVSPGGQQATLMSDVGSSDDVSNLELVLDDEATNSLPDSTVLSSGSFKPTNVSDGPDSYPAPAPDSSGATALSAFDGVSGDGQWRLYAKDDSGGDVTSLTGWSLKITWSESTAPTGSVTINSGAASTSSTAVTLGLSATDPAPASGVSQMRFSNDGVTFSAYQAYAPTAGWTLAGGGGTKTVYAQFRDADGNQSAVVSDTITLSTTPPPPAPADTTSPTVVGTTPKKNAKGVKVTAKVKVKVSEALNPATVTPKTVYLKAKGTSKKIKAKVTYSATAKTIVLKPKSSLKHGKKYTLTATTGIKDVAGNSLDAVASKAGAQQLRFSFTTG